MTARPPAATTGDDLVVDHLPLARSLARRYVGRGLLREDLEQVAYLGLVKAVRGYDARRGSLAAYATATILGELRRHFRDTGWMVRPPRRIQELQDEVRRIVDDHLQRHSHAPSDAELANSLGVDVADVREARGAVGCYAVRSIDAGRGDDRAPAVEPTDEDGALERVDDVVSLVPALRALPSKDRDLLRMRFVEERTQAQIAGILGISQMQVSRRLTSLLASVRRSVDPTIPPVAPASAA